MSNVASPTSTGGGGINFETQVQATFVVMALTQGPCPCFPISDRITSVQLQNRCRGYATDDLLVVIRPNEQTQHRLIVQIKSSIKLNQSDQDFVDTINAFWSDFCNLEKFEFGKDKFALVTSPSFGTYYKEIQPVLSLAKSSLNENEFISKLNETCSEIKRRYSNIIRSLLNKANNADISDALFWKFCKSFEILIYDFDHIDGKDQANVVAILELAKNQSVTDRASNVWLQILKHVEEINSSAGSISRDSVPDQIKLFFNPNFELLNNDALNRLKAHGQEVFAIINDTIGNGVKIDRSEEIKQILNLVENNFIIITGVAGIGKSAISKELHDILKKQFPTLAFKATEFNAEHIDQVFTNIGITDSLSNVLYRYSLFDQKFLFIESIEKIFELEFQDSLRQLLNIIGKDKTWKVIVTCRFHAVDQIVSQFILPLNIQPNIIELPKLNDHQTKFIGEKIPHIKEYLDNGNLIELLRTPFFVKLVTLLNTGTSGEIKSLDQNTLKLKIWEHVIEKKSEQRGGINIKRRKCFIDVAVKRAKTMSISIPITNFDSEAISKLEDDGIIVRIQNGIAPAHDVFEDWALIQFIEDQFNVKGHDPEAFFVDIGTEPAMRRSFRLWLLECLQSGNNGSVLNFITNTFKCIGLAQYWQDEVITALLLSDYADVYFKNQQNELLANNAVSLKRAMHLLMVGCKGPDKELLSGFGFQKHTRIIIDHFFLKPNGSGWLAVIKFIHAHLDQFDLNDVKVIKEVLKDWSRIRKPKQVSFEGAREIGLIALHFWRLLRGKYSGELQKDLLKIALNVSEDVKNELSILIDEALTYGSENRPSELRDLIELSCSSLDCVWLCRALPEKVIKTAEQNWIMSKQATRREYYESTRMGVEGYFGLSDSHHFRYFPASPYQGPFIFLLNSHPDKGLKFIISLINYTTDCYAHSGLDANSGESPRRIKVILNDGTVIEQWGSERLWSIYRATHVGPEIVESALMALEEWFFKRIETKQDITVDFEHVLKESKSVALTSVLVSVALAHYDLLGDKVLPLLRTKEFFYWDFIRQHRDMHNFSDPRELLGFPKNDSMETFHYNTLKDSQKRPHRKMNLESLTLNLQVRTDLWEIVQGVIDGYHKALPPLAQQIETDKLWRIALKRMDLREYKIEQTKETIIFNPTEVAPDIKEFQAQSEPEQQYFFRYSRLYSWAKKKFENFSDEGQIFSSWQEALKEARILFQDLEHQTDRIMLTYWGGPIIATSVFIRDHYDQLSKKDKSWCLKVIISSVQKNMNDISRDMKYSKMAHLDGTKSATILLTSLVGKFDKLMDMKIRKAIVGCLTHANEDVRGYAVQGIRENMWKLNPNFAKSCLIGMLKNAKLFMQLLPEYHLLGQNKSSQNKILKGTRKLRSEIIEGLVESDINLNEITFDTYSSHELSFALALIPAEVKDSFIVAIYNKILKELVKEAIEKENNRHLHRQTDYEFQYLFAKVYSRFVLYLPEEDALNVVKPLVDAVGDCPELVSRILPQFVYVEDSIYTGRKFWKIWKLFSDAIFKASGLGEGKTWVSHKIEDMITTLFLAGISWNDGVKDWKQLDFEEGFIQEAFKRFGCYKTGFLSFVIFLNKIGQRFLPSAIIWLNDAINKSSDEELLSYSNTINFLESLLRKVIFREDRIIRKDRVLQQATIGVLDALINEGSSIAFLLRESIVAPLPNSQLVNSK